jgi:hypothetical protein
MYYVGIDTSKVPVPDKKYVADLYSVIAETNGIKILFGQKRISTTPRLRSLLVIDMTMEAAARFVDTVNSVTNPTYREIGKTLKLAEEPPYQVTDEPEQTIPFFANFCVTAMSGNESFIDFLQVPASAFTRMELRSQLPLDAVVRIDLRSSLFLGLLSVVEHATASYVRPLQG